MTVLDWARWFYWQVSGFTCPFHMRTSDQDESDGLAPK